MPLNFEVICYIVIANRSSLVAQMVKNPPAMQIPGSRRSPGEGHGYPFQYSCLENSMNSGAWRATVHGVSELDMTELLTQTQHNS